MTFASMHCIRRFELYFHMHACVAVCVCRGSVNLVEEGSYSESEGHVRNTILPSIRILESRRGKKREEKIKSAKPNAPLRSKWLPPRDERTDFFFFL